jgi:hypothetical protein
VILTGASGPMRNATKTTIASKASPPKNSKVRLELSNGMIFMIAHKASLEIK